MTDSNTASGGDKLPLTVSNLLASGAEGQRLLADIWECVNYDDGINDFLSLRSLFWKFRDHKQDGWVYLLRAEGTRYFKIGKSINPDRRLRQIKPKMPFETQMVGAIRTSYMSLHERFLHWAWESCRTNGEWFLLPEDNDHAELLIWQMEHGQDQPLSTLESFVGGIIQGLVDHRTIPWIQGTFDTDPNSLGINSAFYTTAAELAALNAIIGGLN